MAVEIVATLELRVDFALPYAWLMRGAALGRLRRFAEAHEALSESHSRACGVLIRSPNRASTPEGSARTCTRDGSLRHVRLNRRIWAARWRGCAARSGPPVVLLSRVWDESLERGSSLTLSVSGNAGGRVARSGALRPGGCRVENSPRESG